MDRHSALRLKTVLDVSHFDRWLTLEGNSKNSLRMVECSYENNFTCSGFNESTTGIQNGWPIIVKRDAWKTASIVGFTSGKASIFIDKGAKNWVARTLSKSMEVQD